MSSGVDELIDVMRAAAHAVRSVTSSTPDELRALAAARDAIDAAMADRLAEFDELKGYLRGGLTCVSPVRLGVP